MTTTGGYQQQRSCGMIVAALKRRHESWRESWVVLRVLIVEDERDVADLVADVLQLEGFEARIASGEIAVDAALTFQPHVVLLDLMMPVVDGFEVARRLGARPETRQLPIVIMTAMHDASSRAAEVGTNHFLAKPFDIGELIRTVQRAAGA